MEKIQAQKSEEKLSGVLNWIKSPGKRRKQADSQLLRQFYVTLDAIYLKIKQRNKERLSEYRDTTSKIEILLAVTQSRQSWESAYSIEQMMVPLFTEDNLDIELQRRLMETGENLSPELHQHFSKAFENATELPKKQALLERIVNDLQWQYSLRQVHRVYAGKARINTSVIFVLAIIAFFLPELSENFDFIKRMLDVEMKTKHVRTALSAGFLGACFSLLIGLKSQIQKSDLENLKVIHRFPFILSRAIIGMGAAMIFFYFMQSGFVKSPIIPTFDYSSSTEGLRENIEKAIYGNQSNQLENLNQIQLKEIQKKIELFAAYIVKSSRTDLLKNGKLQGEIDDLFKKIDPSSTGKEQLNLKIREILSKGVPPDDYSAYTMLIILCFLAGFSEKLVPNLLSKAESQINSKK